MGLAPAPIGLYKETERRMMRQMASAGVLLMALVAALGRQACLASQPAATDATSARAEFIEISGSRCVRIGEVLRCVPVVLATN